MPKTIQNFKEGLEQEDFLPFEDAEINLGSADLSFNDCYIDGTAYIDATQTDSVTAKTTNGSLTLASNGSGTINLSDDTLITGDLGITGALTANSLTSISTNTDLTLTGNGSGSVFVDDYFRRAETGNLIANRSTAQTLVTGTFTNIVCSTETLDSGNNYNNTSGQYTAPVNGYYLCNCHGSWNTSATGEYIVEWRVGSTKHSQTYGKLTSSFGARFESTAIIKAAASTVITCIGYQNTGGDFDLALSYKNIYLLSRY